MIENTTSVAELLRQRAGDDHLGYKFEGATWTWSEVAAESAVRAALLDELTDGSEPLHIGVLLENVPEYLFWIGGAALRGATIVGVNPTRRGEELGRDIEHTDCQFVVTDRQHADLLPDHVRTLLIDSDAYATMLTNHADAAFPAKDPNPQHTLLLLFTSGSTSAPKAVRCTSARAGSAGVRAAAGYGVTRDDVSYCHMPLFHGNALLACWAPSLAVGATIVLRRKFSASGFLGDVREHGCTYFTYVGRAVAYILAQPPTALDRDHGLRLGFGTEASATDRQRFADRFGCQLVESYGSSESAIVIVRTADTPAAALGRRRQGDDSDIAVVDAATRAECPRARFVDGRLSNPSECIGEMVNRAGGGHFEGYYNNDEATGQRLMNGWFWSGDLAYRDAEGFFYFAGRTSDWLRVDSENFAAGPVETILDRAPDVVMAAVYPVPDAVTGDQVMAALELAPGTTFDPALYDSFLAAQPDLGTKWAPRFIRIVDQMPVTANNKVHKPVLRGAQWHEPGEVWWREHSRSLLRPMTESDRTGLTRRFKEHDRSDLL